MDPIWDIYLRSRILWTFCWVVPKVHPVNSPVEVGKKKSPYFTTGLFSHHPNGDWEWDFFHRSVFPGLVFRVEKRGAEKPFWVGRMKGLYHNEFLVRRKTLDMKHFCHPGEQIPGVLLNGPYPGIWVL